MKKFRLMIGLIVMGLLAFIVSVPTQAAPRIYAMVQPQTNFFHLEDTQKPTSDVACPAMIFRNINEYPATINEFSDNTLNADKFHERINSTVFAVTSSDEMLNRMRGRQKVFNIFNDFGLPIRVGFNKPNSVIENRKNKSSPFRR